MSSKSREILFHFRETFAIGRRHRNSIFIPGELKEALKALADEVNPELVKQKDLASGMYFHQKIFPQEKPPLPILKAEPVVFRAPDEKVMGEIDALMNYSGSAKSHTPQNELKSSADSATGQNDSSLQEEESPASSTKSNSTESSKSGLWKADEIKKAIHSVSNIDSLKLRVLKCGACRLCEDRKKVVFGAGKIDTPLMIIGEGPGENEDIEGLPFVGKAGKLLTSLLNSMSISRDAVYITNVVKCRPPGNRNPAADEVQACSEILLRQIEFIKPTIILVLGKVALHALTGDESLKITQSRGKIMDYRGIQMIPTFHPAYLLRNFSAMDSAWQDFRLVRKELSKQGYKIF